MTTRLQGWLEEQARDYRQAGERAHDVDTAKDRHAKAAAFHAVLQHLEDLGPLLSLGEVEEKLLSGPVRRAVAHTGLVIGTTRALRLNSAAKVLKVALDTFNPPVEGGDTNAATETAESPGLATALDADHSAVGASVDSATTRWVEKELAHFEAESARDNLTEFGEAQLHMLREFRDRLTGAKADSATASTEGQNCERGEGQSPREGRGDSHAGAAPLHPSEPESDSSVSSVESTFSRDGGTRHRDPIRRCQPGPGGLLDSTSNANAPLASVHADWEEAARLAIQRKRVIEEFEDELEERAQGYAEESGIPSAYRDALQLLRDKITEQGRKFDHDRRLDIPGGGSRDVLAPEISREVAQTALEDVAVYRPDHPEDEHFERQRDGSVACKQCGARVCAGDGEPEIQNWLLRLHAATHHASTQPLQETCGGSGQISEYDFNIRDCGGCPDCTQSSGGTQ